MVSTDADALMCDFAETYHVYDYTSLPLRTAAMLFMGLKQDSRCKMLISGQKYTFAEMLAVMIYDKLAWLQWAKTKNGAKGIDIPQPLAAKLFGLFGKESTDSKSIEGFCTPEDFEAKRKRLLGGEN